MCLAVLTMFTIGMMLGTTLPPNGAPQGRLVLVRVATVVTATDYEERLACQ